MKKSKFDNERKIYSEKVDDLDADITEISSDYNARMIEEHVTKLSNSDGKLTHLGMWKIKNLVVPKERDPPMAKLDLKGNLITEPDSLKNLYLDTYKDRLKNRDIADGLEDIRCLKEDLWSRRLKLAEKQKTPDWTMNQLDKVLKSLKPNKARGPDGLINELFHPNIAGTDLKNSVLKLMNQIKTTQKVPKMLKSPNITSLYKNKGSKKDLNNDRGIFMLNVLRTILDKLIYFDSYDDIDQEMSDSNIGGRKKKNISNHIFIVNGIINEAKNYKNNCIDMELLDI